jgi:hypothetical protein
MLDKLDSIPWSTIPASSGTAKAVPALLRELVAKKGAALAKARHDLGQLLARDGAPSLAAVYASPFLIELATAKNVPEREAILVFLTDLATGGHVKRLVSGELPPAKAPKAAPRSPKPSGADVTAAWVDAAVREGEEAYEALLGDKDGKLRAAAALLVAFTSSRPKDAAARLAPRVRKEPAEPIKASGLLAVGVLERRAGSTAQAELLDFYTGEEDEKWPKPPPPLVASAATLALGVLDSGRLTGSMLDRVRRQKLKKLPESEFPWNGGDAPGLVAALLPRLSALDLPSRLRAVEAVVKKHPRKGDKPWAEQVVSTWAPLVQRVFARFEGRDDEVLPEELDDDQRALADFAVAHGLGFASPNLGLKLADPFGSNVTVERFLGKRKAGPLEARIAVGGSGPWPIWKWFHRIAAKKADAKAVRKAILAAMTPDEVASLARDATSMAYWIPGEGQFEDSPRADVLLGALDAVGASVNAPDLAGIRFVLESLQKAEWPGKGWRGGPTT